MLLICAATKNLVSHWIQDTEYATLNQELTGISFLLVKVMGSYFVHCKYSHVV